MQKNANETNTTSTTIQVSLEPLKPFRAVVEVVVKRKTGGGRWRYEVKIEATEAPPDDSISLRAPVGGQSSAVFRLCNRYLGFAPFQVSGRSIDRHSQHILYSSMKFCG